MCLGINDHNLCVVIGDFRAMFDALRVLRSIKPARRLLNSLSPLERHSNILNIDEIDVALHLPYLGLSFVSWLAIIHN